MVGYQISREPRNQRYQQEGGDELALFPRRGRWSICGTCGKWWAGSQRWRSQFRHPDIGVRQCDECREADDWLRNQPGSECVRYGGPKTCPLCGRSRWEQSGWSREYTCQWCIPKVLQVRRRYQKRLKKTEKIRIRNRRMEAKWLAEARKNYRLVRELVRNQRQGVSSTQRPE